MERCGLHIGMKYCRFFEQNWVNTNRMRWEKSELDHLQLHHSIEKDVLHLNWLNVQTCRNLNMENKHICFHYVCTHQKWFNYTFFSLWNKTIVEVDYLVAIQHSVNHSYTRTKWSFFLSMKRLLTGIKYESIESESNTFELKSLSPNEIFFEVNTLHHKNGSVFPFPLDMLMGGQCHLLRWQFNSSSLSFPFLFVD